MMRIATNALALALLLAGCAETPQQQQATTLSVVAKTQAVYAEAVADAALWVQAHPADAAVISKAEAILTPEINALSASSAPTTVSGVLTDISNQVAALPAGVISANTKSDIAIALALAQGLVSVTGVSFTQSPYVFSGPSLLMPAPRHFVRT